MIVGVDLGTTKFLIGVDVRAWMQALVSAKARAMEWTRPELTWPWLRRAIFSLRDKSGSAPPLRCTPGPPPSGSHRAKAARRKPRHGDRAIDQAANFL